MNPKVHWDRVYGTKAPGGLSWFQSEPHMSLRLLVAAGMTSESSVIDIGGGDSRLVDRLIARGLSRVFVLDVSGMALARARGRLGALGERVTWIEADVTGEWNEPTVDIWHDRAVFHFLTEAADRRRYVAHVRRAVGLGGGVVIATFALNGPDRCSGLPVVRYSPETLSAELGGEFRLSESLGEQHTTPFGNVQPFCYTRFTRDR